MSLPRLTFVYRKPKWGSTVMRVFQLSRIARAALEGRADVRVERLPDLGIPGEQWLWARRQRAGDVFLFSKSCLPVLKDQTLDRLRRMSGRILFDHVDGDMTQSPASGCDLHLCSSFAQAEAVPRLQAQGLLGPGAPATLIHAYDTRLDGLAASQQARFRAVYMGLPQNTWLSEAAARQVEVERVGTAAEFDALLTRLPDYNFHYGLRPPGARSDRVFKPFVKGFTAGACGANILAHRQTEDVEAFLGADYPYLVSGTAPGAADEVLARAASDFGGPVWRDALAVMAEVADRASPARSGRDLAELLRGLTG